MDSHWKLKFINHLNKNDHSASKNLSDFPTLLRSAFPLVPEYHKADAAVLQQIKKKFSAINSCTGVLVS